MRGGGSAGFSGIPGYDFRTTGGYQNTPVQMPSDIEAELKISVPEAYAGITKRVRFDMPGKKQMDIKIPAKVKDGSKLRLRGQGQDGGDLIIKLNVVSDRKYKIENGKFIVDVPVTIGEITLGTKLTVRGPDGKKYKVTVPKYRQNGTKLKVKDFYVKLNVQIPKGLNKKQKEAMEAYTAVEDKICR